MTTERVTIGDPSRRLSSGGALVVIALVVITVAAVRYGFQWVVSQSDDWSLASARRVVAESTLSEAVRGGLDAELDRLQGAFDAQRIDYDALFASLQRIVEVPSIARAVLTQAAATPGLAPEDAAALSGVCASLAGQEFLPESVAPILDSLRAGKAPAEVADAARTVVATLAAPPAVDGAAFDVVASFREIVDGTLAGSPPPRLAPR